MANLTLINLVPPSLPVNYCPTNYQTLANDIISGTQAVFNSTIGNSFFNFGASFPAINNRVYPWLDDQGLWWIFTQGFWIRKNTVEAAGQERRMFVGSTIDLGLYDGGDGAVTVTSVTGPMWEIDAAFAARFPVGEDQHKLTTPELAVHTHDIAIQVFGHGGEDGTRDSADGGTYSNPVTNNTTVFPAATLDTSLDAEAVSVGGDIAHNNLPPFYGVYFIKRTARVYYTK